ncbi:MAG: dolichyl-phosphate beta-glucosyltransferase [Minisyncoccia bacterium]
MSSNKKQDKKFSSIVARHASSPVGEVRDPASAPSASGLATRPHPRLTPCLGSETFSPVSSRVLLSIVIPAYNESERLAPTLRSVHEFMRDKPYAYEIIVVDDGSRDETVPLVRAEGQAMQNVKLLPLRRNMGKGWAVRTGMLMAAGRYRLFMDADGSTDIRHWPRMLRALEGGADVVIGSRHVTGSNIKVHQTPLREALGFAFRKIVRVVSGLRIHDTQNGFKAFTADAAERIFRRQKVMGWAFDVEILSIARRLGYVATEVPITWVDDRRSRMTAAAMPRMLTDLLRIRLNATPQPSYTSFATPQLIQVS